MARNSRGRARQDPEARCQQVQALRDQLAEWQGEADEGVVAAALAAFDGYSDRNAMLIAMQRPDATDVDGFRAWLARGRCVRRGEKGIAILAPAGSRAEGGGDGPVEAEPGDGAEGGSEGGRVRQFFRVAYVFDVSQTEPAAGAEAGSPAA